MKTNEEKLKKLLEVAIESGWKDEKELTNSFESIVDNIYLYVDDVDFVGTLHSLNDLVTDFEEGEVSFIEALCKADEDAVSQWNDFVFGEDSPYVNSWINIVLFWGFDAINKKPRPTSQRLDWLFETFKHLLE